MSTEPAPAGQDDTADPVGGLYRRVELARGAYRTAVDAAHGHEDAPLRDALDALREATGDKGADADPVVQAVARALIGQGVSYTEWCVYWDAEDPNACSFMPTQDGVGELMTYDDLDEVRQMRRIILDDGRHIGGIARRQVTVDRTPWQVVDTEDGS